MKKPYCKVCHDAGKPESEYTNHHVKSLPDKLTGICKVTCPTLLNTECRFCFDIGHTAKFCPVIANKKKDEERVKKIEKQRPIVKPVTKQEDRRGGFGLLLDINDDDDIVVSTKKEEFPALGEPSKRVISYASIAAKPASIMPAKEELQFGFKVLQKGNKYEKTEVEKPTYKPMSRRNWADDYSSDEEENNVDYVDNSAW